MAGSIGFFRRDCGCLYEVRENTDRVSECKRVETCSHDSCKENNGNQNMGNWHALGSGWWSTNRWDYFTTGTNAYHYKREADPFELVEEP